MFKLFNNEPEVVEEEIIEPSIFEKASNIISSHLDEMEYRMKIRNRVERIRFEKRYAKELERYGISYEDIRKELGI